MRHSHIPMELKLKPRWAAWAKLDGKIRLHIAHPSKLLPLGFAQTTGLTKFELAAAALESNPRLQGLAFVIHPQHPYVQVTLKGGWNTQKGRLARWASGLPAIADSWMQFHPEGESLTILLRGGLEEPIAQGGMLVSQLPFIAIGSAYPGSPAKISKVEDRVLRLLEADNAYQFEKQREASRDHLGELLAKLENVKGSKDNFSARCPYHNDHHNSLSVRVKNGWIDLHCFVCGKEGRPAIYQVLGISARDLKVNLSSTSYSSHRSAAKAVQQPEVQPPQPLAESYLRLLSAAQQRLAAAADLPPVYERRGLYPDDLLIFGDGVDGRGNAILNITDPQGLTTNIRGRYLKPPEDGDRYWVVTKGQPSSHWHGPAYLENGRLLVWEGEFNARAVWTALNGSGWAVQGTGGTSSAPNLREAQERGWPVLFYTDYDYAGNMAAHRWLELARARGLQAARLDMLEDGNSAYDASDFAHEQGQVALYMRLKELIEKTEAPPKPYEIHLALRPHPEGFLWASRIFEAGSYKHGLERLEKLAKTLEDALCFAVRTSLPTLPPKAPLTLYTELEDPVALLTPGGANDHLIQLDKITAYYQPALSYAPLAQEAEALRGQMDKAEKSFDVARKNTGVRQR